jgi:hypothetical protein
VRSALISEKFRERYRTRSHSFPRSSATLLANKGEDLLGLKDMKAGSLQVQLKATLKIVSKTRFNLQEKFLMASQIKNFRNRRPQCVIKKTRKIRGMKIFTILMSRQVC